MDNIIKNVKHVDLNTKIVSLEYKDTKDDLIEYKCLFCNKNYQNSLMKI